MTEEELQIQKLKKEIRKLKEQVPQWVPVEERLPEREGWYLVWTKMNRIPLVRYFSTRWQKFFDDALGVLAWIPLPQAYKEDKNES